MTKSADIFESKVKQFVCLYIDDWDRLIKAGHVMKDLFVEDYQ